MSTSKKNTDQNINADFVCDCDKNFRSACEGFDFYKEKDGKRYCVLCLHLPFAESLCADILTLSTL